MLKIILKKVELKEKHKRTGKTRHYRKSEILSSPKYLYIVQYEEDEGYYLLHIDGEGNELTDTFHETLNDAFEQAKWEFNIFEAEWEEE